MAADAGTDACQPIAHGFFTLASGQATPNNVVFDGERAFWTSFGGPVASVAPCGAVTTIANESGTAIAVDDTDVYWTQWTDARPVHAAPRDGGATRTVVTTPEPSVETNLVLDGDYIYYGSQAGVVRVLKTGEPSGTLLESAAGAGPLAMDATSIYFGAEQGLMKMPKSGGTPTLIQAPAVAIIAIVTDDTNVYYATSWPQENPPVANDWIIVSVPKAGGAYTIVASDESGIAGSQSLMLDRDFLTWSNDDRELRRMSTSGANEVLFRSSGAGAGVAVHDGTIVWAGYGDGTIRGFSP